MARKRTHFIINPRASGGTTGRSWSQLESIVRKHIGDFTYEFTDAPGAATRLARLALKEKHDVIAVVGGDGTISEVVNGYLETPTPKKKPPIVILNQGTGGDFCRTIGAPSDLHLALESIRTGRDTNFDVGRLTFRDYQGNEVVRYFVNVSGCGMAGDVVQAINRGSKKFGAVSYFLASAQKLLTYRKKRLRIRVDDRSHQDHNVVTAAICNGQFFGGGMQISPESEVSDGKFELVLIRDWNMLQSLWYSKNLYNGTIGACKGVSIQTASKVTIEAIDGSDEAIIDCDGEDVGQTPLTAEIIPEAVPFRI